MIVRCLLSYLLFSYGAVAQNTYLYDNFAPNSQTSRLQPHNTKPLKTNHDRYFSKPRPKLALGTHSLGGFAEIGLETGIRWIATDSHMWNGTPFRSVLFSASLEGNFHFKTDYRLTPKIALVYHGLPITVRVQSRWYPAKNLNFKYASWQICPEIGFNVTGVVFFTYGYSFAVTNQNHVPALGNQFMIGLNLFGWLDKEI